jgi:hypothetical protein
VTILLSRENLINAQEIVLETCKKTLAVIFLSGLVGDCTAPSFDRLEAGKPERVESAYIPLIV